MGNRERLNSGGSLNPHQRRHHPNPRPRTYSNGSVGSPPSRQRLMSGGSIAGFEHELHLKSSEVDEETIPSASSTRDHPVTRRRKVVNWIQEQKVPLLQENVYLVSGLDQVLFGTDAAADTIVIAGVRPPRYLWYMVSGFLCDILQFAMDFFLRLRFTDASVCWALSFVGSIVFRHTSHRYFVFGDYVGGYWASLGRMYAGYSVIIVLSTLFNMLMTRVATLNHNLAWILTLLWTGLANYFILKRIWSFGGKNHAATS